MRTEDGYILTVHRAGHGRAKNGTATPLLMGHGGGSSDEQWLLRSKDNLGKDQFFSILKKKNYVNAFENAQ